MLLEDFVEFLSDRDEQAGAVSRVDPDFQVRLRSRLWRSFVLARLRDGDEVH